MYEGPITDAVSLYTADHILSQPSPQFGTSVCGAELLEDGHLTLAISTRGDGGGSSRIQLFSGSDDYRSSSAHVVGQDGHQIGTKLACDDVDGDGKSDALVGAPSHNTTGSYSGAVALFFGGGSGTLDTPDATVLGTDAHQSAGEVVGYTGDGSAEWPSGLAVGSHGRDVDAGSDTGGGDGSVYLVENVFPFIVLTP